MSGENRIWHKLRRSKSANILHPRNRPSSSPPSQLPDPSSSTNDSPPSSRIIDGPPDSPPSSRIIDRPPSSTPPSPSLTPTKKSWERHYKSFLSRKKLTSSPKNSNSSLITIKSHDELDEPRHRSVPTQDIPSPPVAKKKSSSPSLSQRKGSNSSLITSKSRDELDQPRHRSVIPKSLVDKRNNNSGGGGNSNNRNNSLRLVPGSSRLVMRGSSGGSSGSFHDGSFHQRAAAVAPSAIPMPSLSKRSSSDSSDAAVHGGNIFSAVFGGDKSPMPRRKTESENSLDSTLRRGHDKEYSPKNVRFIKDLNYDDEDSSGRSRRSLDISPATIAEEVPLTPAAASQDDDKPASNLSVAMLKNEITSTSKTNSAAMKKNFTEFHNSAQFGQDATSAYLGDDPSVRQNQLFASLYKQNQAGHGTTLSLEIPRRKSLGALMPHSAPLETVSEDNSGLQRAVRILKPVLGPEAWQSGRRYLIAPAAMSSCRIDVLGALLSGSVKRSTMEESPFGVVELGKATVTYIGDSKDQQGWTECKFELRQNYLLEYDANSTTTGVPRGIAQLPGARAYPHADFATALELKFYGSPCAKADRRVLMIRVDSKEERDRWVTCLNDSANLSIKDLYSYDEDNPVGRGRYAIVYPARRHTDHAVDIEDVPYDCAIKVIDKNEFWTRVVKGKERADTIVREVSVQATLTAKCSNVPSFLRIQSMFETSDHVVIELELLEGTDLFQHIWNKGVVDENEAANIMKDILTSLDVMKRTGLAHRDVKPANIIVCNKEKDGAHVKLGDFGMSAFVGVDGHVRGRCGTPGYVAPEIFTAIIHGGYGSKADVFSAGVVLYLMLCGYEPFYGESDSELIAANKEANVEFEQAAWANVSSEAKELLRQMLAKDPKDRISAKDALQHSWIANNSSATNHHRPRDLSSDGACTIS